ncbi:RraA family protein [Variovorax saccharolyticus]|uniref:RraA family protein n=1 Tax=Variovorax saccharolyticus TaxID=3053516 RepID=UPI002575D8A6|nr:RraA family protein [Variovorax sp. J31P216]MDM0028349.1 RraA family protein [Variovorax sp. J31P216]
MNASDFDSGFRSRLDALATSNLSDACDSVGIPRCAVQGIVPRWGRTKVVGRAVTIRMTAAGAVPAVAHLGVDAIANSNAGDVIVVDNRGDLHHNCWGEILALGAKLQGVSGVVVDGAVRDVDACETFDFPVHARGTVPSTARGRIVQEAWNVPVRLGDAPVRPGDVIVADVNGVVVVPIERLAEVVEAAETIMAKENAMLDALRAGESMQDVDRRFNYEQMLRRSAAGRKS